MRFGQVFSLIILYGRYFQLACAVVEFSEEHQCGHTAHDERAVRLYQGKARSQANFSRFLLLILQAK